MKKLIQFGAGNIGRSFIGASFALAGYEVAFIDIDQRIVGLINERREYKVLIKGRSSSDREIKIPNVRAINSKDSAAGAREISDADYLSTSVGKNAFSSVMEAVASGLIQT